MSFGEFLVSCLLDNFLLIVMALAAFLLPSTRFFQGDRHDLLIRVTVGTTLLLAVFDAAEAWTAGFDTLVVWRPLLSCVVYSLRPAIILEMICLLYRPKTTGQKALLYAPFGVCVLSVLTTFFSGIVFSYTEDNHFQRGPLGYLPHVIFGLYLALFFVFIFRQTAESDLREAVPLFLVGIACLLSGLFETFSLIERNESPALLMLGCLFYDLYLYRMYTMRDQLTGLFNRQTYYSDVKRRERDFRAIVTIDMNGLKTLNDHLGHMAGDEALRRVGETMRTCTTARKSRAYRLGGDEFAILFYRYDEEEIRAIIAQIRACLDEQGYSCSFGYAARRPEECYEDFVHRADEWMYHDKEKFYQQEGHNRRQRS